MITRTISQINLELAAEYVLAATRSYLDNTQNGFGDRYGFWHGTTGISRAKKVQMLLSTPIVINDPLAVFSIFLAIFGEPNEGFIGFSIGRSNKLASFIADRWIEGKHEGPDWENTLSSTVFPLDVLYQEQGNQNHIKTLGQFYAYTDRTRVARSLLQHVLHEDFNHEKHSIKKLVRQFRAYFENNHEEKMSFSFTRIQERESALADGTARGVFADRLSEEGPTSVIASFFSPVDTARVRQINKAAYLISKKTEEDQIERKINTYST